MSKIKLFPGLIALLRMAKARKSRIALADENTRVDPVAAMAKKMHPEELKLVVRMVHDETRTVRTYTT